MSDRSHEKKKEVITSTRRSELSSEVDSANERQNKHKRSHDDYNSVPRTDPSKRKTSADQSDLPADSWHSLGADQSESIDPDIKTDSRVKLVFKKRETTELPEEEVKVTTTSTATDTELPYEVDAFMKGKNKYKHPYGDWKPVVKAEPLKRDTFADQLDLPENNWYLPENQPASIIPEIKDDSHVKLVFKEREITGLPSSSSSKSNETTTFKKPKTTSNRQLRGSSNKDRQQKDDVD